MRSFFKIFFASLLALVIFCVLAIIVLAGIAGSVVSKDKPEIGEKTVLVLNLSEAFPENVSPSPVAALEGGDQPSLHELLRLIDHARTDDRIAGIYIEADGNANGAAATDAIRQALLRFKQTSKFVIAYGNQISEQAYFAASAADKIYLNPAGGLEWEGFSITLPFIKGTLEKLDIQPQIFYAGKFKSATEIFRTDQMTPENRLQTEAFLGSMYQYFLQAVSQSRKIDTARLHQMAVTVSIQTPADAEKARLVDGLRYDDQVKSELKERLKLKPADPIHLVPFKTYAEAVNLRQSAPDRIAVIVAEGDIVDGEGTSENIGGENFRAMIRKARHDKRVKAIVLRVNSGGGSALASEIIWRELQLARTENKKPVIASFGDVAASGGYYIACGADSIFAHPNSITGSIGVFGVIPNMEAFFKNKLGITFDQVTTAPHADGINVVRPLDEKEKQLVQASIDRIYIQFMQRVAAGRHMSIVNVDSIAQGRVWSGSDARDIGLVDRLAGFDEAIAAAAKMAKLDKYSLMHYPEKKNWLQELLGRDKPEPAALIAAELGEEQYKLFNQMKKIRELTGSIQARLPFEIIIH